MSYGTKPSFIRKGSILHDVLKTVSKEETFADDFNRTERKDGLYPAARHGFVRIFKNGKAVVTKAGKNLCKSAR